MFEPFGQAQDVAQRGAGEGADAGEFEDYAADVFGFSQLAKLRVEFSGIGRIQFSTQADDLGTVDVFDGGFHDEVEGSGCSHPVLGRADSTRYFDNILAPGALIGSFISGIAEHVDAAPTDDDVFDVIRLKSGKRGSGPWVVWKRVIRDGHRHFLAVKGKFALDGRILVPSIFYGVGHEFIKHQFGHELQGGRHVLICFAVFERSQASSQ